MPRGASSAPCTTLNLGSGEDVRWHPHLCHLPNLYLLSTCFQPSSGPLCPKAALHSPKCPKVHPQKGSFLAADTPTPTSTSHLHQPTSGAPAQLFTDTSRVAGQAGGKPRPTWNLRSSTHRLRIHDSPLCGSLGVVLTEHLFQPGAKDVFAISGSAEQLWGPEGTWGQGGPWQASKGP